MPPAPVSAWTRLCSAPDAPIRSTGAPCGPRWGRCSDSPGRGSTTGKAWKFETLAAGSALDPAELHGWLDDTKVADELLSELGKKTVTFYLNVGASRVDAELSGAQAMASTDDDVTITNLTMRDITNAPIYLRLGGRNRAPEGTPVGTFRRVNISNVTIHNAPVEQSVIIAGVPGQDHG